MKLLSCHVENYGKFTNTDLRFEEDLTSLCEANGYGKTTLSSFFEAMFYGLDSDRTNSVFNERRHYYPFAGGNFGGSVTFSSKGKIYKIERYFDEKSETRDSVTLYVNGKSAPTDGNLGELFFGIDRQSFERTVFISASEIEIASTGSIDAKLNNFIEGGNDDTNLQSALARLEGASKKYKKSKQGNDLISEENRHIARLSEAISNAEAISAGLPAKYARFEKICLEIRNLTAQITRAQSAKIELNDWAHYDEMIAETADTQRAIRAIENRYPYGVPAADEIARTEEALEREKTLAAGRQKLFGNEDEVKFSSLSLRFSGGVPSEEELTETENKIRTASSLSFEIDALRKAESSRKEELLRQRFARRVPSSKEMEELDQKTALYKKCEAEYNEISGLPGGEMAISKAQKKLQPYLILAAVCALLLAAGLFTVFYQLTAGVIMLTLGAVGLAVTGFLYLNKKTGNASAPAQNPLKTKAGRQLEELYHEIQAFLMPYGYAMTNGALYAVVTFKEDVQSYLSLLENDGEKRRALEGKLRRFGQMRGELSSFFARYQMSGDNFVRLLADLRSDLNIYRSLQSRKEIFSRNESDLQEKIAENRKYTALFCRKYRFDIETITDKIKLIADDSRDLAFARKTLREQQNKAVRFKSEKGLGERPAEPIVDLMKLNGRFAELQDEKNALLGEITDDEYEAEKLDGLQSEMACAKERAEEYKYTYAVLCKTMEALKQADGRLKDKYVKPIRDKFLYYSSVLERALGEKITMSADFEIRYERNGKERSEKHLSAGQRSICALCFRLALIDNMYAEEKPFLIFDDPFVNLDEEHMKKVKFMLKELSKRLQIVYFSCHPSRSI